MSGSGLEDLLGEIFAPNVIQHLISGKAYARSIRGHLLIYTALLELVLNEVLELGAVTVEDLDTLASVSSEDDLDKVKAQADKLIDAIET